MPSCNQSIGSAVAGVYCCTIGSLRFSSSDTLMARFQPLATSALRTGFASPLAGGDTTF